MAPALKKTAYGPCAVATILQIGSPAMGCFASEVTLGRRAIDRATGGLVRSSARVRKRFQELLNEPAGHAVYNEVMRKAQRFGPEQEDILHEAIAKLLLSNPEVRSESGVRPLLERVRSATRKDSKRINDRRAKREVLFHELQHGPPADHGVVVRSTQFLSSELARSVRLRFPELAAYSVASATERSQMALAQGQTIEALRVEMSSQRMRARAEFAEEYMLIKF